MKYGLTPQGNEFLGKVVASKVPGHEIATVVGAEQRMKVARIQVKFWPGIPHESDRTRTCSMILYEPGQNLTRLQALLGRGFVW